MSTLEYGGAVGFFTVTAPGRDVLPFIPGTRQVEPEAAKVWNATAPARLSMMHRKAAAATRRRFGSFKLVARVWAFQKRGVLHFHMLLPGKTPGDRAATIWYVERMSEIAAGHGFGFTDFGATAGGQRHQFMEAVNAQGYLAKYVTKDGENGKPEVLETAAHPAAPERISFVQPGLSEWTMAALRRKRLAHMLLREHGCEGLAGHGRNGWITVEETEGIIARLLELDRPPPNPRTDGTAAHPR